jgi:hypothetical protein
MPKHTKIDSTTKKYAAGKGKRTTSKDVPGTGMAKKTATAIEKRRKLLQSI